MIAQGVPADSVRQAVRDVFARPAYQWTEQRGLTWLRNAWLRLMEWLQTVDDAHPVLYDVILWGSVVVLVALLVHFGYIVWRILRPTTVAGGGGDGAPGPRLLDAGAHVAHAEELARAGRYAEALGHRFIAVVLELEQARALRFHPSKTPAEYVGEARLDDAGRATFAGLVARLYRHLFGAVPCAEAEYRDFGATAHELTRHVLSA